MRWRGLLASVALLIGACAGEEAPPAQDATPTLAPEDGEVVALYFPGAAGRLLPEERSLELTGDAVDRIERVVTALLAGPQEEGRGPVFDFPVAVAGVYLTADGVAFVDLAAAVEGDGADESAGEESAGAPRREPATGSREEIQTVYSLVNSVTLNVPEARRLVLLWEGRQGLTFAGHLDTSRPLGAAPDLIARAP